MATLIDERPVEEELDNNEEVEQVTEEPQVEETLQEEEERMSGLRAVPKMMMMKG